MAFSLHSYIYIIDLKIAVLDIYNSRLDKRLEKKNFIFDRNFLDFKRIQAVERKRPKDEKELLSKMRVFAKMQSPTEFDSFVEGIKSNNYNNIIYNDL